MGVDAVLLSLLAAVLFAVAAVAEQRSAANAARTPTTVRSLRAPAAVRCAACPSRWVRGTDKQWAAVMSLLRSPVWLAGIAADIAGFLTQAAALHSGPLVLVQALLVTVLPLSVLLASATSAQRVGGRDLIAVLVVSGGLAGFVAMAAPHGGATANQGERLGWAMVAVAAVDVAGFGVARRKRSGLRPVVTAVMAATAFSFTAALVKTVTDQVTHMGAGLFAAWQIYALVIVAPAGLILEQIAYASGGLAVVMTALTLTDPALATAVGIIVYGEHMRATPEAIIGSSLSALLVAGGVAALSRSPLMHQI